MDGDGSLGLKVKITPEIDRSKLNAEAKKVEKELNKGARKIPVSLGGGRGSGLRNAAVGGAVGGAVAMGIQGVFKGVMKLVSMVQESSPMLKAQLKMLNQGFMMVLRPIGDTLAMLLRPIAMFFRVIGREIMKRVRAKRNELKGEGLSGADLGLALTSELPSIYLSVFTEELEKVDWSGLFAAIGETLWTMFTEKFPEFLTKLNSTGGMILLAILTAIGAMTILAGLGATIFATAVTAIGTMTVLGGLGGSIYATATLAIGDMAVLAGLGALIFSVAAAWLYAQTPEGKGTVQDVFSVPDVQKPPTDPRADTQIGYYNMSDVAGGDVWKPFKDVYNWLGFKGPIIPGLAGGGEVMSGGLVNLHPGEVVKDSGSIKQMIAESVAEAMASMGGRGDTFVIPGSAIADAIDRRIDYYYRTKVVNRR